jgi:hypothetical protein
MYFCHKINTSHFAFQHGILAVAGTVSKECSTLQPHHVVLSQVLTIMKTNLFYIKETDIVVHLITAFFWGGGGGGSKLFS